MEVNAATNGTATGASDSDSNLKRRNTIPPAVVVPTITNGDHHHHPSPSPSPSLLSVSGADLGLVPLKSLWDSYTSLKDLLPHSPSSIMSPTPAAASAAVSTTSCGSGYEISIRNRLVKQAAWAYLQPTTMSSSPTSSRRIFFSGQFLRPKLAGILRFVVATATRVYDWLVDTLWLILCR